MEGDRAIRQVIASRPEEIIEILTIEELAPIYHSYTIRQLTVNQVRSISHTRTPQGTLAVVNLPADIYSDSPPSNVGDKILLLEDIQDPGNVGTLIRTAAAFGFSGVIMTDKSADPLSPKCVQSTAGTVLAIWLRRTALYLELVKGFKEAGYTIVAADINGVPQLSVLRRQPKLILALGNEGAGLSKELLEMADFRLIVPIVRGKSESLNVAVCGAICMYLSSRKDG